MGKQVYVTVKAQVKGTGKEVSASVPVEVKVVGGKVSEFSTPPLSVVSRYAGVACCGYTQPSLEQVQRAYS